MGGRSDAEAVRERAIETARLLFLERGFLSTTSDDIASELGISKATLYKVFPSKKDILRAVVRAIMGEVSSHVERLLADGSLGFVEKMVALFSYLAANLSEFGPVIVRDLRRSAPEIWREIDEFRREKILKNFRAILEAGQREGFFRADIDLDLCLEMFVILMRDLVNPVSLVRAGRSPSGTFESVIKVFFQGLLTEKGRADFAARTPALFESRKENP